MPDLPPWLVVYDIITDVIAGLILAGLLWLPGHLIGYLRRRRQARGRGQTGEGARPPGSPQNRALEDKIITSRLALIFSIVLQPIAVYLLYTDKPRIAAGILTITAINLALNVLRPLQIFYRLFKRSGER